MNTPEAELRIIYLIKKKYSNTNNGIRINPFPDTIVKVEFSTHYKKRSETEKLKE